MVFKPFTHLARQSFVKSFTHGYAQSVVAASQSSYASTTTSLGQFSNFPVGKFSRTSQLQNVFQTASGSSGAGAKAGHQSNATGSDGGLAAYYAAWQHAQQTGDDNDWRQFQFTKRIGWKASREGRSKQSEDLKLQSDSPLPSRVSADRAHSASAADDIRRVQDAAAEAEALAKVDEAIAQEIISVKDSQSVSGQQPSPDVKSTANESSSPSSIDDAKSSSLTPESSLAADSVSDVADPAGKFGDRIIELQQAQRYAEVPVVFEAMLKAGHTPSVEAYNALLVAAMKLPTDKYQAVPKALDVYADMLYRKVTPNAETYSTLIQFLTTRAIEAMGAKEVLEQSRARFGGMEQTGTFLFDSSALEHDFVAEDDSIVLALKQFKAATSPRSGLSLAPSVYHTLIVACARQNRVQDMIEIFSQMEVHKIIPHAAMFAPMISAFAAAKDLKSAVECYNEYKALAVTDNEGIFSIIDRKDNEVYAALIKAYLSCGKTDGGLRFFDRIVGSFEAVTEDRDVRMNAMENTVVVDALVQHALESKDFSKAMSFLESHGLSAASKDQILAKICVSAADANASQIAEKAYLDLTTDSPGTDLANVAMLAMCVRQGQITAASHYWTNIITRGYTNATLIEPTTMYAVALLRSGNVEQGLVEARNMFGRVRHSVIDQAAGASLQEEIDEAIVLLGRIIMDGGILPSEQANMTLIWTMVENGGLVSPVAENAIAGLGPAGISQLGLKDLELALQVQAGMLINRPSISDLGHAVRFCHILEVAMSSSISIDAPTVQMVSEALRSVDGRPDLIQKWQHYLQPPQPPLPVPARYTPAVPSSPRSSAAPPEDTYDPHAYSTDYRGSAIIADQLESNSGRPETHLNEAMAKFRNIRRAGRHPRYITYARLITAAAKVGKMAMVNDILGLARNDVPLIPQYSVVRYGWISILDAMVAACLTIGDRNLATRYHQELLDMGAAPSANTFGLYITTLKESTKTFDEATEAVKVFHRALSEGVEPSSFLYNALIGKLGKARRIDDCMLYFAEMRSHGIRPTSVTYGTIVNALCRVSDEKFAEEMFDEMELMPNYKPRPAPYNSLIQYFLNTKRDRSKVLTYYNRMTAKKIAPTMHTYKLLVDAYASLEPVDMQAAEGVLEKIKASGQQPEAVHYASLIHAKGCVLHDMEGARKTFDEVMANPFVRPQPCIYQALFEAMVANHQVKPTGDLLKDMAARNVEMTPYIANTLIHGWAAEGNIANARSVFEGIGISKREPSTYEAMTRAYLSVEDRQNASRAVQEMLSRGYPSAVAGKIVELLGGGAATPLMA